jgi:hypothetical protein
MQDLEVILSVEQLVAPLLDLPQREEDLWMHLRIDTDMALLNRYEF